MEGPITTTGTAPDRFHWQIVDAVNFTDSKAYDLTVKRLESLGLGEDDIILLIGAPHEK